MARSPIVTMPTAGLLHPGVHRVAEQLVRRAVRGLDVVLVEAVGPLGDVGVVVIAMSPS